MSLCLYKLLCVHSLLSWIGCCWITLIYSRTLYFCYTHRGHFIFSYLLETYNMKWLKLRDQSIQFKSLYWHFTILLRMYRILQPTSLLPVSRTKANQGLTYLLCAYTHLHESQNFNPLKTKFIINCRK